MSRALAFVHFPPQAPLLYDDKSHSPPTHTSLNSDELHSWTNQFVTGQKRRHWLSIGAQLIDQLMAEPEYIRQENSINLYTWRVELKLRLGLKLNQTET